MPSSKTRKPSLQNRRAKTTDLRITFSKKIGLAPNIIAIISPHGIKSTQYFSSCPFVAKYTAAYSPLKKDENGKKAVISTESTGEMINFTGCNKKSTGRFFISTGRFLNSTGRFFISTGRFLNSTGRFVVSTGEEG